MSEPDRIAELLRVPCSCVVNDLGLAFCQRCAELSDLLQFPAGMFFFNAYLPADHELGGCDPYNHVGKEIRRDLSERMLPEYVKDGLRAALASHHRRAASILVTEADRPD